MANPLVGPTDTPSALQDLNDRLTALEQTSVIPVGLTAWCPGPVPNGWLALDGSTISAARYGQLVAYLGGVTTLPDVRGRVMVGDAVSGTFATLLATGGVETVTLTGAQSGMPAHSTGVESATHTHNSASLLVSNVGGGGGDLGAAGSYNQGSALATSTESAQHTHAVAAVAATTPVSVVQPFIVFVAIIKF